MKMDKISGLVRKASLLSMESITIFSLLENESPLLRFLEISDNTTFNTVASSVLSLMDGFPFELSEFETFNSLNVLLRVSLK